MLGVDLEDGLGLGRILPRRLQDACQVHADIVLVRDQAGWRVGQAQGHLHVLHALTQARLHLVEQLLVLVSGLLRLLLLGLIFQRAQIQPAPGHGHQLLAIELGQIAGHPLVDTVGEQQDLDALLAEDLEVRAVLGRVEGFGGDEVDLVLAFLHAPDVVGERHRLIAAVGQRRRKAQQAGDLLLVGEVLAHTFLEHLAEGFPEGGVLLLVRRLIAVGQALEQGQHFLRAPRTDGVDVLRFLQDLARHVQRQIGRIDHTAHEAQVARHQLLGVVHDEHPLHIELDAMTGVAVPQIEGRVLRDVEQVGVFVPALDTRVGPRQRVLEVVRDVLVKTLVLVLADVVLGARPQGIGLVDRLILVGHHLGLLVLVPFLLLHHDRLHDVVGVLAHQALQLPRRQQVFLSFAQVQGDLGAAARLFNLFHGVGAGLIARHRALPLHALARGQPRTAGQHGDAIGDQEGGIKAHPELTDEVGVLLLVTGELTEEFPGARLGDRTQMGNGLVAAHADAVVGDGDGLRLGVEADADFQLGVVLIQAARIQRLETQLVAGVGRV